MLIWSKVVSFGALENVGVKEKHWWNLKMCTPTLSKMSACQSKVIDQL